MTKKRKRRIPINPHLLELIRDAFRPFNKWMEQEIRLGRESVIEVFREEQFDYWCRRSAYRYVSKIIFKEALSKTDHNVVDEYWRGHRALELLELLTHGCESALAFKKRSGVVSRKDTVAQGYAQYWEAVKAWEKRTGRIWQFGQPLD